LRGWLVPFLALALAVALVRASRSKVFAEHARIKNTTDAYLLPPPSQLRTLSLGYDAAVADLLWAHTLVAQGIHLQERRRFASITQLYEAINELAPTWRTPYALADALITLQSAAIGDEEVSATRRILERGVQNRPLDAELWLNLGQFVAFIAPSSYLEDKPEVASAWRQEGLSYLERAAELGAASHVGWQALGGASRLAREGKRDAAIRYYERQYAVAEDPELRRTIERRLAKLLGEEQRARIVERRKAFDAERAAEFPWLGDEDTSFLLLGPRLRADCVGNDRDRKRCATTWRAWAEAQDAR
jgi:tetratricopeptide (TPR) repeat protein